MTKQERFKKYLAGDYNTRDGLDVYMIGKMTKLGWTAGGGKMKYTFIRYNSFFGWNGDRDWHHDIKIILRELD